MCNNNFGGSTLCECLHVANATFTLCLRGRERVEKKGGKETFRERGRGKEVEEKGGEERKWGEGGERGGEGGSGYVDFVLHPHCRYDNAVAGTPLQSLSLQPGMETERLIQMDYLSGSCWQWVVPHPLPTLLTALLRYMPEDVWQGQRSPYNHVHHVNF